MNVEPFAQNRVKLKVPEGVNDYINASPIQLGKRRYIATQGPKDTNVNAFYRMLSSEVRGKAIVVMLTQTHESGREKCFQYYPLTNEESPLIIPTDEEVGDGFHGKVELIDIKDDASTRSQIRHLRLQTETSDNSTSEKVITHLLFSGWPDFLVPEGDDRAALIRLVQLSARLNAEPSTDSSAQTNGDHNSASFDFASSEQDNPRVIHCSAGVGRSGTFIALDYLLSMLYSGQLDHVAADADPIAETVDNLRQQRMMMVQGEGQFHFVYEVLREAFLARMSGVDAVGGAQGA
jgi:protein-tyrosine phosphatase